MKKKTIICTTTSTGEILRTARAYLESEGFEVQEVLTENGERGLQARKSSWLRRCSGTSYALQLIVKEAPGCRFELQAGWGEWLAKGAVVLFATFIALGVLIIPALVGIVNQKNLPEKCLEAVSERIKAQNALCRIYGEAAG